MFNRRRISSYAVLAAASLLAADSLALGQAYVGPNNGSWDTAGNWNPGTVPNGGTVAVTVSNGSTVAVPAGVTRNVATLTIGTTTSGVSIANGTFLVLNGPTFSDAGLLTLAGTGGDTRLRTAGQNVTLSGGGAIAMVASSIDGGGLITNAAGHTIRGTGTLGNNNTLFANVGTLSANVAGGTLNFDSANGPSTNSGTISASNGGIFSFTGYGGGNYNNTGGTVLANTASEVDFTTSAELFGGTLTSAGTGVIRAVDGQSVYLHDLTNAANLRAGNGAYLFAYGNIVNNNAITIDQTTGDTRIRTNGVNTSFSGTGTITVGGGTIDGGAMLTFGAGQTVQGPGAIGANSTFLVNNGTIQSNVNAATLAIDPVNAAGAFDNNGLLRATGGGILSLSGYGGGDFDNAGGTIRAEAGSQVQLTLNAYVANGQIASTGTGQVIAVAGQTVSLANLTSTADLRVGNGSFTYLVGTITNNNAITLDQTTGDTRLRTSGDVTIAGTGSINLPAGGMIDGGNRITLPSTQTIRGQGSIGTNNTAFTSAALIDANVAGATLTIDPANVTNAFLNTGTLRASGGGVLNLSGYGSGDFANAGGTITATGAGSQVRLSTGVRVIGGAVTGTSGGAVNVVAGDTVYLQGITLGSTLTQGAGSYVYVEGSLVNNGTIVFSNALNSNTRLRTNNADVSITGTGQIVLSNTTAVGDDDVIDGGATLTLGAGQTVRGSGSIGANNTSFVNNGLVDADNAAGGLGLDPASSATGFTNNNILRATAGGKLILSGYGSGSFNNAATASILASGAGSEVQLTTGAQINGGALTASGGGVVRVLAGQVAYLAGVTLAGPVRLEAGSDTYVNGGLTNNGVMTLAPSVGGSAPVRLRTDGADHAIAGTGSIVLANTATVDAGIDGGGRVTFGAGQTVSGSGSLGSNNTLFTNNGTIVSDHGGIGIDPASAGPTSFVNNGTLRATTGGLVMLSGYGAGSFSGGGAVIVDAGSNIRADNSASIDFTTVLSGAGTFTSAGGSDVTFTAYREAGLVAAAGSVARIRAGGANVGTSKVTSVSVENTSGGRLDVTDHGLIVDYTGASPAATLRGYLASGRNGGAWQGAGIMSSLAGTGGKVVGYAEAAAIFASPTTFLGQPIDGTSVLIRYTINGDTNLDAAVNFDDLLKLAQNYDAAATNKVWSDGDFSYDGTVNFDDLLVLAQNYGSSFVIDGGELQAAGGSSFMADYALARSMVPEPGAIAVILGLALQGGQRRTRRA